LEQFITVGFDGWIRMEKIGITKVISVDVEVSVIVGFGHW
jgi:hypothetical protein